MTGISSQALSFGGSENKKLFNGYEKQNKEFSDGSGLEWYDYKHRFFDDQLGRFFCVDRLASDYPYYSPYQFAGNEPTRAIDLDGLEPAYTYVDPSTGQISYYPAGDNLKRKIPDEHQAQFTQQYYGTANQFDVAGFGSGVLNIIPVVGEVKMLAEAISGRDLITGDKLAGWQRALALLPIIGTVGREASSVWALDKFARGNAVEDILGRNLPRTFKTFDKFEDGVATSIKSMDLTADTYQKGKSVYNTLKGYVYVNETANFKNYSIYSNEFGRQITLTSADINTRVLELAIQPGKATLGQWQQIADIIKYAKQKNVQFTISLIK